MPHKRKNKTLEERVEKYLAEWAEFLGLSQTWEIRAFIVDEIETIGSDDSIIAAAEIHVLAPYQKVEIAVAKCMADYSDYDLERAMLHELLHIPLEPIKNYVHERVVRFIYEGVGDLTETAIDFFTRVLLRTKYGDSLPTVRMDK